MSDRQTLWEALDKIQMLKDALEITARKSSGSKSINVNELIAISITSKLLSLYDKKQFEYGDMVRNVSSLRYAFELLVVTKLLLQEPGYAFQVLLGIHRLQENQNENTIKRLKQEIKILNELGDLEVSYSKDPSRSAEEIGSEIDRLKNEKLLIWSDGVEQNGYHFHAHSLEVKILAKHEERKIELDKLHKERAKELLKNGIFTAEFETKNQSSRVFKSANDDRSWKDKAAIVGLGDEYDFIYSYTSNLMHCTSYSLMTPNESNSGEIHLIDHMSEQFIRHIHGNLERVINKASSCRLNETTGNWE